MSNYDYNKGYRWFHFKKDASIDPSLPPLVRYRSEREAKPLLVVSNEEQVNTNVSTHVHDRSPSSQNYAASSVHLPLLLCAASPMPSYHTEDRADLVARTTRTSPRLTTPAKAPLRAAAKQSAAFKGKKATERGKKAARKADPTGRGRQPAGKEKELKDCLFIQNGVERFPGYQDGFLSEEKARDIRNWIDRMPDDSTDADILGGIVRTQQHPSTWAYSEKSTGVISSYCPDKFLAGFSAAASNSAP